MTVKNSRIVLIGGSSGIGLATAKVAVARGANVVICGRSAERLASAAKEIGKNVETFQVDATAEKNLPPLFSKIGPFDHLATFIPAAPEGSTHTKAALFSKMDSDSFANVFRNRFWTQCWAARHGSPHIRGNGSIVFVSNGTPRRLMLTQTASASAVGALDVLARMLALELPPIRVNTIVPGFTATPTLSRVQNDVKSMWDDIVQTQPIKRLGTVDEVADAILFLMDNDFTTGARLEVDGGFLVH